MRTYVEQQSACKIQIAISFTYNFFSRKHPLTQPTLTLSSQYLKCFWHKHGLGSLVGKLLYQWGKIKRQLKELYLRLQNKVTKLLINANNKVLKFLIINKRKPINKTSNKIVTEHIEHLSREADLRNDH